MKLSVVEADITTLAVDAVVNAANEDLAAGGGVCGAIFRAAGPGLAEACAPLAPCPTGGARITPGFALPAERIIHAVGPVWRGGGADEDRLLTSCYQEAMRLAAEAGCRSIAFPAISTGIYGFPPERAAPIAVAAVKASSAPLETVLFCCFGRESADLHWRALPRGRGRSEHE